MHRYLRELAPNRSISGAERVRGACLPILTNEELHRSLPGVIVQRDLFEASAGELRHHVPPEGGGDRVLLPLTDLPLAAMHVEQAGCDEQTDAQPPIPSHHEELGQVPRA